MTLEKFQVPAVYKGMNTTNTTAPSNLTYSAARVLLGWMDDEQGVRIQYGLRSDAEVSAAAKERLRRARQRVAARSGDVDQRDIVAPSPKGIASYVAALQRHPQMGPTFAAGWTPSLIDLRKLCAFQARVFTDDADQRVSSVDAGDLQSIAAVTMPLPSGTALPAFFDSRRNAWVMTSSDPNLKVVGNSARQQDDGTMSLAFSITVGCSFVAALNHQGRYYLADGYHRAVAFLRRGITHVPGLTRTLRDNEPFDVPAGMLSPRAVLGERPPQLSDFLAEDVSISVVLPMFRKVILIQAIEIMA